MTLVTGRRSACQSVGEIERQLRMTQPTVSKHLRVLRQAGFVESALDAPAPSLPAET
jgi:DNA-binding transcriptional ArsR family regulator